MTYEEVALKHLKSRVNYTKRNHGYYAFGVNLECLTLAIKALEKQIPKSPL